MTGSHRAAEPNRSLGARFLAGVREVVIILAMALGLSFIVKSWLVQAFFIPSGSMENTLVKDDRVIVNKLVPQVADLHRGDVIVFEDPGDWLSQVPPANRGTVGNAVHSTLTFLGLLPDESQNHLIKRVIGLPGDHVACCTSGKVTVNGAPISEPYIKPGAEPSAISFDIIVPPERVWVMGDNRSNSEDSRFHDPQGDGKQGSVPISLITGRASAIVWPIDNWSVLSDQSSVFATVPEPDPSARPATSQSP